LTGGKILEVSPAGAKLLGARRSDLLKQNPAGYVAGDFRNGFRHHCKKVFDSGNRETYDLQILKKGPGYILGAAGRCCC